MSSTTSPVTSDQKEARTSYLCLILLLPPLSSSLLAEIESQTTRVVLVMEFAALHCNKQAAARRTASPKPLLVLPPFNSVAVGSPTTHHIPNIVTYVRYR